MIPDKEELMDILSDIVDTESLTFTIPIKNQRKLKKKVYVAS